MKELTNFLKDKRSSWILLVIGITGILLIAFSGDGSNKKNIHNDADSYSLNYQISLENDLKGILEKIEGVGKANVMITLEGSEEYVYAQNEKQSTDSTSNPAAEGKSSEKHAESIEKSYVFTDGGSNRKALKISSREPLIKGVLVVCQGGGNAVIKARVTEACSTALGIKYSQIFVAKSN